MDKVLCQTCKSERIIGWYQNCDSKRNVYTFPNLNEEYPDQGEMTIPNVSEESGVGMDFCLDCGQIQGKWPIKGELEYEMVLTMILVVQMVMIVITVLGTMMIVQTELREEISGR